MVVPILSESVLEAPANRVHEIELDAQPLQPVRLPTAIKSTLSQMRAEDGRANPLAEAFFVT